MRRASGAVGLKEAVREHQNRQHLSPQQLEQLLAMQGVALERRRNPRRGLMSAVAGVVLAFAVGWLGVWSQLPPGPPVTELIADEVARNHLKREPMEVTTGDLPALRSYFHQLDFRPVDSDLLAAADTRLVGGRYCSLQGHIAAQLHFMTAAGDPGTLYQARYDPEVFGILPRPARGEAPVTVEARGVAVTIWVERGVVFAMAGAGP